MVAGSPARAGPDDLGNWPKICQLLARALVPSAVVFLSSFRASAGDLRWELEEPFCALRQR